MRINSHQANAPKTRKQWIKALQLLQTDKGTACNKVLTNSRIDFGAFIKAERKGSIRNSFP